MTAQPDNDQERLRDKVAWAIVEALHANVPEDERPMSWSDLNGEQENRIRAAACAAITKTAEFLSWANDTLGRTEIDKDELATLRRERDEARAGLDEIARQKTHKELLTEGLITEGESADFEGAYDMMIECARAARGAGAGDD